MEPAAELHLSSALSAIVYTLVAACFPKMAPSTFVKSRELASADGGEYSSYMASGRPYFPNLCIESDDDNSICRASLITVAHSIYIAARTNAKNVDLGGSSAMDDEMDIQSMTKSVDWGVALEGMLPGLTCSRVTGGLTNELYRVTGFRLLKEELSRTLAPLLPDDGSNVASLVDFDSVLVRKLGAEGMIDRDVETSTYAYLCNAGVAYR